MENPFVKLSKSESEDGLELTPSAEPMTLEEKQKRLAELKEWLSQAESIEEEEKIKEEISNLEQKQ